MYGLRREAMACIVSAEALLCDLAAGLLGLAEALEAHAGQHRWSLRELHVAVVDNLDDVAPRVADPQPAAAHRRDPGLAQRRTQWRPSRSTLRRTSGARRWCGSRGSRRTPSCTASWRCPIRAGRSRTASGSR